MSKKGFTLIELLAVIVILAVITVIAVPKILDVIEGSRKSAAKSSAELYVDAIENYQATEFLKGNVGLIEGEYNISEVTVIGDKTYKKLNELVKIKGSKPTTGKIGITKNSTVGVATMCINNYVVEYSNNKSSIVSEDCGEMGTIINYNISSEEWEMSKILTITYPEGNYEYYYELESGAAKVDGTSVILNKKIKSTENILRMELTENSKVSLWMIKNGKKISLRQYEETKIDNTEIGVPEIASVGGYPIITQYGISLRTKLSLKYEKQQGISAYYSTDNKETWKKYKGEVNVDATKVYAKLVRDVSKREGEIIEASVSVANDALGVNAYDGDESTYVHINSGRKIVYVDNSMIGKTIKVKMNESGYTNSGNRNYIYIYDTNNKIISSYMYGTSNAAYRSLEKEIVIPENISYISFASESNTALYIQIKELKIVNYPSITKNFVYPKLTEYGVVNGHVNVEISYFDTSVQKLYKVDDGKWQEYQDKKIKLATGQVIYAKGIDKYGTETDVSSYTSVLSSDALGVNAYDGNESTYVHINSGRKIVYVDNNMIGKTIKIKMNEQGYTNSGNRNYIYIYDTNNKIISSYMYGTSNGAYRSLQKEIVIPENTSYISFASEGNTALYIQIKEILIINE